MYDELSTLTADNPDRRKLAEQFQSQICNKEKQHVWCCENGKPKSDLETNENLNSEFVSGKIKAVLLSFHSKKKFRNDT